MIDPTIESTGRRIPAPPPRRTQPHPQPQPATQLRTAKATLVTTPDIPGRYNRVGGVVAVGEP